MLESVPGTWPSAQFDCLDLGLAVCRSLRVAAGLLRVLVASPSPSLLWPGARDFFDFLCLCLCSAASAVLVLLLSCFASEAWRNVVAKLAPCYCCSRASGLVWLGLAALSR